MWEGRHLKFGFGTLAPFERIASDFRESPLQAGCSGQGLGGGGRRGSGWKTPPGWVGLRPEGQSTPSGFHPMAPKASYFLEGGGLQKSSTKSAGRRALGIGLPGACRHQCIKGSTLLISVWREPGCVLGNRENFPPSPSFSAINPLPAPYGIISKVRSRCSVP